MAHGLLGRPETHSGDLHVPTLSSRVSLALDFFHILPPRHSTAASVQKQVRESSCILLSQVIEFQNVKQCHSSNKLFWKFLKNKILIWQIICYCKSMNVLEVPQFLFQININRYVPHNSSLESSIFKGIVSPEEDCPQASSFWIQGNRITTERYL